MQTPVIRSEFPTEAKAAHSVYARTYRRKPEGAPPETWEKTCDRILLGIAEIGNLNKEEVGLIRETMQNFWTLMSGRWHWVGGTAWVKLPENFYGAYNCESVNPTCWEHFGLLMNLAMQGVGTGAVLSHKNISQLPAIRNRIHLTIKGAPGDVPGELRTEETEITGDYHGNLQMIVGDSRKGWVYAYQNVLAIASEFEAETNNEINLTLDLSHVRPTGERLRGFGGVANPIKLQQMFERVVQVLNAAVGRQLKSVECCLIIDEAAAAIVAGSIRRSAGMRQFDANDKEAATAKLDLWTQDEQGNWRIDPKRDALRMANHTRIFHTVPTLADCLEFVRLQTECGEGALQFAPEAIARGNADLLDTRDKQLDFIDLYTKKNRGAAASFLKLFDPAMTQAELDHRMNRLGLNPCGK